jgi:hypothetical protein
VFPMMYELNFMYYIEEIGLLPKSLCVTERPPTGHFDIGFLGFSLS